MIMLSGSGVTEKMMSWVDLTLTVQVRGQLRLLFDLMLNHIFQVKNTASIASARAGNVIGGGDWAANRIIPDCVLNWSKNEKVELRNPFSTRPWQHVLEPLGGYLTLGTALSVNTSLHGEAF